MARLILSKLCSLVSTLLDCLGIVSFNTSQYLDDKSNELMGRESTSSIMERYHDEQS